MTLAFSYIRFSSEKQSQGDSLRRQIKYAEEYAAKHNLTLDTHSYRDLGLSAFKGRNAVEGRLGAFLEAVDEGLIPKGSYLLVESLDRISRAEVDEALELFLKIIKRGIILVTLQDGQVFSKERIKEDRGISLIISITVMIRAHEESATKQDRVRKSWAAKRAGAETGVKMTAVAPSWLTLSEDRKKWIVDRAKAKVVQRIFDMSLAGVGTPTIARKFNEEGVPTMQRAAFWTFGVINAILKNESVTGTFTPKKADAEPIKDYYPRIISDEQFFQVREHLQKRRWVAGHNSRSVLNLFAGICFCASCNNAMRVKSAVSSSGKTYLQCGLAYAGDDCDEVIFPGYAAERAILNHLAVKVAGMTTDQHREDPRVVLQAQKGEIEKRIDTLIDALETLNSDRVKSRIEKLQLELQKIDEEIARTVDPKVMQSGVVEALEIFGKLKKPELLTVEERLRVQTLLKRVIESVHFTTEKSPTVAVKYHEHIRRKVDFIDVSPFMDKVGGDRRKRAASVEQPRKKIGSLGGA